MRLAHVVLVGMVACSPTNDAADGGTHACVYPRGPYGHQLGDTLDPGLSWQGYAEGSSQATTIAVTDYFDCDGQKGINAILLDESATWCAGCITQAMNDGPLIGSRWGPEGVKWITLMVQNAQMAPATLETALSWKSQYGLEQAIVCADPQWTLEGYGLVDDGGYVNGVPTNVVVDPRTMKIVSIQPVDEAVVVDQLAKKNQPPADP